MPRTKDLRNLFYDEANQPYIEPGRIFRTKSWNYWGNAGLPDMRTSAHVFHDFNTDRKLKHGEVLMYLKYLGPNTGINSARLPGPPLPLNSFWNLTHGHITLVEGYHWWIEDEMQQLTAEGWVE